jgi:hypothetical protein
MLMIRPTVLAALITACWTQQALTQQKATNASTLVLADALHSASLGKVTGGKFVEGGGWTAVGPDDRIVWELPNSIGDGSLEIEVRNFNPPQQAVAKKNNIIGMWETLWESGGMKDKPNMDNFNIRVGQNYPQMKLELHTHGFAQHEKQVQPFSGGFDPSRTYRLKSDWRQGTLRFFLDGQKFYEWASPASDPMDRFRYVHIGSDPQFKGATPGPVFSNLRVISLP